MQQQLMEAGTPTAVQYPMPLHNQECFQYLNHTGENFMAAENAFLTSD